MLQLTKAGDATTDEAAYFKVIENKTAVLFAAASQGAALLNCTEARISNQLYRYGLHLGIAFQLADDVLDYLGDPQKMGKNIGDDLGEGKPTLPLIATLQLGSSSEKALIADAITRRDSSAISAVVDAVKRCGALDYTLAAARHHATIAEQQLATLMPSSHQTAMLDLCRIAVERDR